MSTKVPLATSGESAVMDEAALLEWLEAADILMIRDEARRAAGWPSALSVHDIAYLQFPDTTAHGWQWRNEQDEARDRLMHVMNASIAAGRLRAEVRKTERRKPAFVASAPAVGVRSIWSDGGEDALDAQRVARAAYDAEPDLTIEEYFVVHREDFASWAGLPEDKRCPHLRSWIGTTKKALPPKKKKPSKKMEVFLSLLEQIESEWEKSGRGKIDRIQWPGFSKDLCVLAGRLIPNVFGEAIPKSFYENYPKKAGLNFAKQKGVGAVYAEIFPPAPAAADQQNAA